MKKTWAFLISLTIFSLATAVTAQAQSVLTILDAEISPQFPEPGGSVTASFRVQNTGDPIIQTESGLLSLGVRVYSTDENGNSIQGGDSVTAIALYTGNINALNQSQIQRISGEVFLDHVGPHIAEAMITIEGYDSGEVERMNYLFRQQFSITHPADLVMDGSRLNDDGQLVLRMHNSGGAIPDEHFRMSSVNVQIGSSTYTQQLSSVDPTGQLKHGRNAPTSRVRYAWPTDGPQGITLSETERHQVKATVDYNNSINDHRRSNNTRINYVGGQPDLVVCYREYFSSKASRRHRYRPVVRNIGNARSGSVNLRFYIENKGGTNHFIPPLPAGGVYKGVSRRVFWAVRGDHNYTLTLDNLDDVKNEIDEHNNVINGKIHVTPSFPSVFDRSGSSPFICSDGQLWPEAN